MDITLIEGCEKLAVQIVQVMAENVQHLSKLSQLVCQNFSLYLSKKIQKYLTYGAICDHNTERVIVDEYIIKIISINRQDIIQTDF